MFIDEVLLVRRIPMRLGNHAQLMFVRFFHDWGRTSVLVVCGDGYAAPQRARTKHGLQVRFGRKRDKGVSFWRVSGFVEVVGREGHALDAEARSDICVCVYFRVARGAIRRNERCPRRCGIAVVCIPGVGSDIRGI